MYKLINYAGHVHSTFKLPNLSSYFPYFSTESNTMSGKDFDTYLYNLDRHTSKVKAAYSAVICDLQKDLERNSTFIKVINCLKAYDKTFCDKLKLADCGSIEVVFSKIIDHLSFFDLEMITVLTNLCSSYTENRVNEYKTMFEKYSKRRVVECPSDAFGDAEELEKVYVLKTDRNLRSLEVKKLSQLCYEITNILGHKKLLQVSEGCVQLIFRASDEEFTVNVTEEQQQALRNIGVLSITYGDQMVDISKNKNVGEFINNYYGIH